MSLAQKAVLEGCNILGFVGCSLRDVRDHLLHSLLGIEEDRSDIAS